MEVVDIEVNETSLKKHYGDQIRNMGFIDFSIGLSFFIMSYDKAFYDNDECIFLKEKAQDFGIALLILSIIQLIFFCLINQMEIQIIQKGIEFFSGLSYILGIVFFVLLIQGIKIGEPCGALRILSILYVIMILLSLLLFLILLSCLVFLSTNHS